MTRILEPQPDVAAPPRPAPLPVAPPVALPPDGIGYRVKRRLLGQPLQTEQLDDERLGKPTALAVFASDNLSSSAYATEEILRTSCRTSASPRSRWWSRSRSRCWSSSAS